MVSWYLSKKECKGPFDFSNIFYTKHKGKTKIIRYCYNSKGLLLILVNMLSTSSAFKIKEGSDLLSLTSGKYKGIALGLSPKHFHKKVFPFVYYHELGHIMHKHLNRDSLYEGRLENSISRLKGVPFGIISQEEMEADDFAVRHCAQENVRAFFSQIEYREKKRPDLVEESRQVPSENWESHFSAKDLRLLLHDLGIIELELRLARIPAHEEKLAVNAMNKF